MRSKHNSRREERASDSGQGAGIMIASGIVLVMIMILACVLVWKIFHQEKSVGPVVSQTSQENFNDTLKETTPLESTQKPEKEETDDENSLGLKFEEVSEIVTAKEETNLRSEPSTEKGSETVVVLLKNGETVERTGINKEYGWSRLIYQDKIVYASTSLLVQVTEDGAEEEGNGTTEGTPEDQVPVVLVATQAGKVLIFTVCEETVVTKVPVNLRTEPSGAQGDASIQCEVEAEAELKRTAYDETTGWSQVEYKGQTLYVVSRLVKVLEEE